MSTTTSATTSPPSSYLSNLGLGYSIAIALGLLVLLSTILLASYICCRASRHPHPQPPPSSSSSFAPNSSPSDGIILPRIIFVAEDDDSQENLDGGAIVGLDPAVINSYPKFEFKKDGVVSGTHNSNNNNSSDNNMCSICLCDYKDSEMLRMMPECRHFFHLVCIDAWLKLNGSCPVCRNSPLPTPLSTPLSEVVPLSQYAADRWRRR